MRISKKGQLQKNNRKSFICRRCESDSNNRGYSGFCGGFIRCSGVLSGTRNAEFYFANSGACNVCESKRTLGVEIDSQTQPYVMYANQNRFRALKNDSQIRSSRILRSKIDPHIKKIRKAAGRTICESKQESVKQNRSTIFVIENCLFLFEDVE